MPSIGSRVPLPRWEASGGSGFISRYLSLIEVFSSMAEHVNRRFLVKGAV